MMVVMGREGKGGGTGRGTKEERAVEFVRTNKKRSKEAGSLWPSEGSPLWPNHSKLYRVAVFSLFRPASLEAAPAFAFPFPLPLPLLLEPTLREVAGLSP